jgi:aconitate hydratase
MLVVAFAIAGRIDINLNTEPVGLDPNGEPVYLDNIWPSDDQIRELVQKHVKQEFFKKEYEKIYEGDLFWQGLDIKKSTTFKGDKQSTYIKNPPYFENFKVETDKPGDISEANALVLLGDSVTTDHLSPAGAIPKDYPAGKYLIKNNVKPEEFNSYGARRGNHEVMMRGTFGNIRIKNQMVKPKEGSFTLKFPSGEEKYIYDAAMEYQKENKPLVVLGGKEYGAGSSRDWAAKGTALLGVKAIIAESYERIHRSNLVGMGVLPLVFKDGESWESLGLDGSEKFSITGIENMEPRKTLEVTAKTNYGTQITFSVTARLDTVVDVEYFENNGILPCILRKLLKTQ